jgi:hypothetical protein
VETRKGLLVLATVAQLRWSWSHGGTRWLRLKVIEIGQLCAGALLIVLTAWWIVRGQLPPAATQTARPIERVR